MPAAPLRRDRSPRLCRTPHRAPMPTSLDKYSSSSASSGSLARSASSLRHSEERLQSARTTKLELISTSLIILFYKRLQNIFIFRVYCFLAINKRFILVTHLIFCLIFARATFLLRRTASEIVFSFLGSITVLFCIVSFNKKQLRIVPCRKLHHQTRRDSRRV